MSDRFHVYSMQQLTDAVFEELRTKQTLFGIPKSSFFVPSEEDVFRSVRYGQTLETPFGVAAGPHTQLARNIIAAWTCGARFIELKTVQTLDELNVSKPCIDMEDEGYNVEWSQELRIPESLDEYVKAWVLIHALHLELGFPGTNPGVIFNLSVGYNLAGILNENVQGFLSKMRNFGDKVAEYVEIVAKYVPAIKDIEVPAELSDNITLSTMHGCPPDEIEKIAAYLIEKWHFHTTVKLNPTLLGPDDARRILNEELGFEETIIPDQAFGHDLKYVDAVPMLHRLMALAEKEGVDFAVKLTNTLEVQNHRDVFSADEKMMYMSGRALHAISTNVAAKLSKEMDGKLEISYAGGADAFNVASLIRNGFNTVTVSSDLLRPGGYMRMLQYIDELAMVMDEMGAQSLKDLAVRGAVCCEDFLKGVDKLAEGLAQVIAQDNGCFCERVETFAHEKGLDAEQLCKGVVALARRYNTEMYATEVTQNPMFMNGRFDTGNTKGKRKLSQFDCIMAPCTETCPVDQKVPQYMAAVADGDFDRAAAIIREDNPMGATLSRICDHKCQTRCIRTHYEDPLHIREIKRAALTYGNADEAKVEKNQGKVAIVGAGPCGMSCALELARAGFEVTIFDEGKGPGGVARATIPAYRLPDGVVEQDMKALEIQGVEVRYEQKAGRDFKLSDLNDYDYKVLATGAQAGKKLGLEGEDAKGVYDALTFLRSVRAGSPVEVGKVVGIVGAGDVALDAARTAFRMGLKTHLIYRRTLGQAPASDEELFGLLEEDIEIHELAAPKALVVENGELKGLICQQMQLGAADEKGRISVDPVEGEEVRFELDTLIVAVSQRTVLDFFDEIAPTVERGAIVVDKNHETSIKNVFAGGDVADRGPATAVLAASDGKAIAAAICAKAAKAKEESKKIIAALDREALHARIAKKARRIFALDLPELDLDKRQSFNPILDVLDREAAMEEASRCLQCDTFCSICTSVCPNRAFLTYEAPTFEVALPNLIVLGDAVGQEPGIIFAIRQAHQTAVLASNCNECGNCRTFCPTSGAPYRDKPRIYFDRAEFEGEKDNAFFIHRGENWSIEGLFAGENHMLVLMGDTVRYSTPLIEAQFDKDLHFKEAVLKVGAKVENEMEISLRPAAVLYTLLRGISESAAYIAPKC